LRRKALFLLIALPFIRSHVAAAGVLFVGARLTAFVQITRAVEIAGVIAAQVHAAYSQGGGIDSYTGILTISNSTLSTRP
jgi:hypothetical protein